jgi:phospho-N-acetylmuramoyl-pentapeptide-transferase
VFYYLYKLAESYPEMFSWLRLLRYTTFRAAGAGFTSFLLAVIIGPRVIRWLRRLKLTDSITKNDSLKLDQLHSVKKDTPTMGGLLMMGGTLLGCLLWTNWLGWIFPEEGVVSAGRRSAALNGGFYATVGMLLIVALTILGFVDDYVKLRGGKGLRLWNKLAWQVGIALTTVLLVYFYLPVNDPHQGRLYLPFLGVKSGGGGAAVGGIVLGAWIIIFGMIVIVGSSNSVNLADGLDGLAGGCGAIVATCYMALCYIASNKGWCGHLLLPHIQGAGELAVCSAALAGACLGFLWYNCHPADVFMGDTGSLPMGGFIGFAALMVKHEILLVLVAGVFVAEALSVLLQIASFRLFGKRIFKIAPLHHHFEFKGWQENKVVVRFWVVGIVLALASIATLKIR